MSHYGAGCEAHRRYPQVAFLIKMASSAISLCGIRKPHPSLFAGLPSSSSTPVVVVSSIEDRKGHNSPSLWFHSLRDQSPWNLLSHPLVWASSIEVIDVFPDNAMQLPFSRNHKVIEPFSHHTSQEPFADRVGFGSAVGRLEDFDGTGLGSSAKGIGTYGIAIANQGTWSLAKECGFAELPGHSVVGRIDGDRKMNDGAARRIRW